MKRIYTILFAASALLSLNSCQEQFDRNFTGETLRFDYRSTGTRDTETVDSILCSITSPWSGPRKNLVDTANLGDYRIIMKSAGKDEVLYQSGFCTLFGEWRTTDEALRTTESYWNSKNLPMPKKNVKIFIECRNKSTMQFETVGSYALDVKRVQLCKLPTHNVTNIHITGPSSSRVDLTFLAEGYQANQEEKFIADVKRFTDALFDCPPFDRHRDDFNVRAVMLPSDSTGVDFPGLGIYRSTALNSHYYTFGVERYLMTSDMLAVGDAIWDVPTDAVFILVNEPVYGGGGIYNFYAIGSSDNARTLGVFIHEFGHSFGALADEYFTSTTPYDDDAFYRLDKEPWEVNITTLVNSELKWKDVTDSLYEGGGYLPKGIYRPADHCMMRDFAPFCPVCVNAIERNIAFLCDK